MYHTSLSLPPNVPVYVPLLGGAFAQMMVVELFGGYGNNFVNPALAAQGFLLVSFSTVMSTNTVDAISVATPLVRMADGQTVDLLAMFLNKTYGTVGDISGAGKVIRALSVYHKSRILWRYLFNYACIGFKCLSDGFFTDFSITACSERLSRYIESIGLDAELHDSMV